MDAVSFLSQYQKLELQIYNKRADVERKRSIAASIGGFQMSERVQSSGTQSKMADRIIDVVALETEIEKLIEKQNDIINVIESLEAMEYDVLYKIYILGVTLKEVATLNSYSYNWAYKWYKKGIASVQKILDDRIKN
jgi:hypothetical protein